MKIRLSILMSLLFAVSFVTIAQDYDDIYYNSSSSKKKETKKKTDKKKESSSYQYVYDVANGENGFIGYDNNRDVDEYNRRYVYRDTLGSDTVAGNYSDFTYTDRIRRFHNPTVIVETNDPDVVELYYNTTPTVNLIVGTPSYWDPYWNWGFYDSWTWGVYPSYRWHSVFCSPWSYDFGWSFGWSWHHHYHHPVWGGPVHHPGGPGYVKPMPGNVNNRVPGRVNPGRRVFGQGSTSNSGSAGRRPNVGTVRNNKTNSSNTVNNARRPDVTRTEKSSNSGRRPSVSRENDNKRSNSNFNSGSYSGGSRRGSFSGGGSRGGGRGGRR